jgi:hypothetical protein
MSHEEEDTYYDCDSEENITSKDEYKFLTTNFMWGHDIITSFEELMTNEKVLNLLLVHQEKSLFNKTTKLLASYGEEYTLLNNIVFKAKKNFEEVSFYSKYNEFAECVKIGDKIITKAELVIIYNAYKNEERFYDENDRKISYCGWSWESYYDYYKKYNS